MPIKDRRTKLFLLFFLMGDEGGAFVSLNPYFQNVFDLSVNQKTKGSLSSMLAGGVIEKQTESEQTDQPGYRITEKGKELLCLEFPFFRYLGEEWDGLWRIISYEIPEKKREIRDRLRREMKGWGLGPWHRSFWITPHPIVGTLKNLVYGREEEAYIQSFEATHVFGDREILVEKVWGKTELDRRYRDLFKTWHEILSTAESNEEKLKKILYRYIEILRDDPGLPASLVGQKWIAFEAYDIFKEVKSILLK